MNEFGAAHQSMLY